MDGEEPDELGIGKSLKRAIIVFAIVEALVIAAVVLYTTHRG